ncbi:predicted protein [Nematostella vectensis]|uniref:F5/8 type C domain-containing protein n=1 Tax=Nematostella vectensis TaxID=45351 RepID=A7RV34_NEMVE|nr:predicted protein [Nematostella vectensis]|eukprot:XP_001636742.1 predicted protein [Nematostella vectensis]
MARITTPFFLLYIISDFAGCTAYEDHSRQKRSAAAPKLEMEAAYGSNVTDYMDSGSTFLFRTTLRHAGDSKGDAKGVRVLWILSPFVKFDTLLTVTGTSLSRPSTELKDDSVTFKMEELNWGYDITFEFRVKFNDNKYLKPARHHVINHAQLSYYNSYSVDASGAVAKGNFFSEPMRTLDFVTDIPGCNSPLGMESGDIKDYQLSASTSYSDLQPSKARKTSDEAWCSLTQVQGQYLQVDFMQQTRITGLTTWGRNGNKYHWTSSYLIAYTVDDVTWANYSVNGYDKMFQGNRDRFTPVTHWLEKPFYAIGIRIIAMAWDELICIRLELYGCAIPGSEVKCISPLGMESGQIPDEALTTSVPNDYQGGVSKAANGRLNKVVTSYPNGWAARMQASNDYLQIDFGSLRKVTRVAIQGAYSGSRDVMFFTKAYTLSSSRTGLAWTGYTEDGTLKNIKGPSDSGAAKWPLLYKLKKPIVARYLRIHPTEMMILPVLRAEVYGCLSEPLPLYTEDIDYMRRSFLLDPKSENFFVCMYSETSDESSCFVSKNHQEWRFIDPDVISIIGINTLDDELYSFDRRLNLFRSRDLGLTWSQISPEYLAHRRKESGFRKASTIPENFVQTLPTANQTLTTSNGDQWGVSSNFIHFKTAGSSEWIPVGSWKCCGE